MGKMTKDKEAPCEACEHFMKCAINNLACIDFAYYSEYGRNVRVRRKPTKIIYDLVFNNVNHGFNLYDEEYREKLGKRFFKKTIDKI